MRHLKVADSIMELKMRIACRGLNAEQFSVSEEIKKLVREYSLDPKEQALLMKEVADDAGIEELRTAEESKRNLDKRIAELNVELGESRQFFELMSCGMPIFPGKEADRRKDVLRMEESIRRLDLGAVTPSERLRLMVKHGRRTRHLLGEDEPLDFTPFSEAVEATGEYKRVILSSKDSTEKFARWEIRKLYSAALWARYGCNQFSLSENLAAALMLTEAPKVDAEEMALPYPVFAISIPSGIVPFFVPDENGSRYEWADTLWVEQCEDSILLVVRWRYAEIVREASLAFAWQEDLDRDSNVFVDDDVQSFDAAAKLLRNFILWLGAEGGIKKFNPEQIPKKLAEKRARSGKEWPRQWIFGKDVKLAPELRRSAAEIALGRSSRHAVPGWKVRARFTVRGHWRQQVHGPMRALRRRQWIAPFWKGPKGEEAWAHIYHADEAKR